MGSVLHAATICPGFTDTEILRAHIGSDPDIKAGVSGINRLIEPEEIAELIRYAHHNPVINSAVLHANLGQKPN
jgi:NAD(P)-dependent dehydrogenase (short-subunit alcohol dehydrogenase family)